MKPRHEISTTLRRHRLLADGMTQQDLADAIGVTRQTIHSIEKGRYAPSVGLALKLAGVFDVRVEDIFTIDEGEDDA